MNQIPILIVGAGPTGLMMAIELTRHGVPFRIIDKKAEYTKTTNAAGIQTRTIEILEHIGLSDQFLAAGLTTDVLRLIVDGTPLATLLLNNIDSYYNYILMLPQSQTEAFFNEHLASLNVLIERSVELIDFKEEKNVVTSTLKHADGSIEMVESNWIIGCDGYHSVVRDKANIKMTGSDVAQEFLVADLILKTSVDSAHTINMYFTKGTILGVFPLGNNRYRIVANSNQMENKKSFSDDEIKAIVSHHSNNLCEVTEILWSSPFWIHSKIAETLHKGSVFIAGDAAHVHSPAGAQGMNTGVQDAYNLAWKLALVVKKQANVDLLDTYHPERYPIIKLIVSITEKLSHLALTSNSIITSIRNFFFKYIAGKNRLLQNIAAGRVTQLSLNYRKSPLTDEQTNGRSGTPKPGDRIIDGTLPSQKRLYDYIRNTKHNLLLFTGTTPSPDDLQNINEFYIAIAKQYPKLIKSYIVSPKIINHDNIITDVDLIIHQRYHITKPSMCLIRPDHYIALFTSEINYQHLHDYLNKWGYK